MGRVRAHALDLQGAQQLTEQQRVAARGAVAGRDEGRLGVVAEPGPDEQRGRLGAERLGMDAHRRVVLGDLGDQALVLVRLAGTQRRHDQHRQALEPAQQEGQGSQRSGVAPLEVVDREHQRLLLGRG